eukprot:COSAG06_NODE_43820_length_368_cov_1.501859_1_plen_80_part_10
MRAVWSLTVRTADAAQQDRSDQPHPAHVRCRGATQSVSSEQTGKHWVAKSATAQGTVRSALWQQVGLRYRGAPYGYLASL